MLINCDMGESYGAWTMGQDELIMPYIDMANIACGMHASDPTVMRKTISMAKQHGVRIGAHPGYADLQGFGRRSIEMALDELRDLVIYQLGALAGLCRSEEVELNYVKPHGALYNGMMKSDAIFETLLQAQAAFDASLPLMVMAVPDYQRYEVIAADYQIELLFEAFVDRTYQSDGRLTPRTRAGACHTRLEAICAQAMQLAEQQKVMTLEGQEVTVRADTLCIHGDGELALDVAKALNTRLRG